MKAEESGAELFEFALITPLPFTPLHSIFWMRRAYNIYQTIARVARQGACVAVTRTCSNCSPANAVPSVTAVENAMLDSLASSSLDKSKVIIPTCSGNLSSKSYYQREVTLNSGNTRVESGLVVSLSYPVNFPNSFLAGNQRNIDQCYASGSNA